jgi:hypothetical protein
VGAEDQWRARDQLIAALARAVARCAHEGDRDAAMVAYRALGQPLLLSEDGRSKALGLYECTRVADTGRARAGSLVTAILDCDDDDE